MVIDDYLPFNSNITSTPTLLFDLSGADNSLWGPFLEKVWAKVSGNYEMIIGGNAIETYDLILGAPSYSYNMYDPSGLDYDPVKVFNLVSQSVS